MFYHVQTVVKKLQCWVEYDRHIGNLKLFPVDCAQPNLSEVSTLDD